ncbi:hypothetical protein SAMN04487770_13037 [Butyrivibrio sp. ob235]|uniref:hypothetical protein n=1 Tax=Butyrivibrio sp. ob235 TaxID=1761780 RepID=UPI0008B04228|nr:hypothetical protein [Butyrivibrio sp. ob235]SEM24954.1 hypothetical protein SAMN04487770_13037 [Butyrivibrio sp. ob235]
MKIYEIFDKENDISIGILLYYEKEKSFIIELQEYLDEWSAPLLLTNYVKRGILTIPRDVSLLWVKERIIPNSRQNIGDILTTHGLREYDEIKFLELSHGRCSQDSLYIKRIEKLPEYVLERQKKNLTNCTILDGTFLLCFFADDTIRKIDLRTLSYLPDVDAVIRNRTLFSSCQIGTGGYFITFNDSIDIPASELYEAGTFIPLRPHDFFLFAKNNLADTTECCEILECSRQNLSYMVKRGQLTPVKENVKGNLFSKGDVVRNMW